MAQASEVEIRDVAPGLWVLRLPHPHWRPEVDWQQVVTMTYAETGGERLLLDPIAPPTSATEAWEWLDARQPTVVVVLKPDHVRDVDVFVRRYNARGFGPRLYFPGDLPESELKPVRPDNRLPGGAVALYDGRGGEETPLWLPEQRTIVFADALTERGGELRVWTSEWHEERALPALRRMLDLPFERVVISHGEPVHPREAFEAALRRPTWPCSPLHYAALLGSLGLVRRLVEGGADVGAEDEIRHATPLDWAREAGQREVVAYLESVPQGAARR
jgi:glyoxylase-like metal-dependent hydrolase (beta-lactamase superfamily II)